MTYSHADNARLLILGESNSVYTDGWVSGFAQQTQDKIQIVNSSLGSTGIFNAIYKLIQLGSDVSNFDALIIDSSIQDASFYKHKTAFYFRLLEQLISYLRSHSVFIGYVQFESLRRNATEENFYQLIREFLDSKKIPCWNIPQLILKHSDIKVFSELHFAYSDIHHIKREVAFNLGKIIGHEFLQSITDKAPEVAFSPQKITNYFDFIGPSAINNRANVSCGQIQTTLIKAETFFITDQCLDLTLEPHFVGQEIIALVFNATNSNGILNISSTNKINKNLSNASKLQWQGDLVWARTMHDPVRLGARLLLNVNNQAKRIENTEYCSSDFFDTNLPQSIELLGFITRTPLDNQVHDVRAKIIDAETRRDIAQLLSEKQFKKIEELIQHHLSTYSKDSFLWKVYGAALLQLNKIENALQAFQTGLRLSPNDAELHNAIAAAYQSNQDFKSAEKHYLKAITLSPVYFEALFNLGDLYFILQQFKQAVQYFTLSLQQKFEFNNARVKRGIANHHLEKFDDAENDFRHIIKFDAHSHEAHCNLANTLKSKRLFAEAEKHYQQAIELNPTFVDAYSNLSNLMCDTSRYQEALNASHKALEVNHEHIGAINNHALALRGLGKLREAAFELKRALKIAPDFEEGKLNLAYILLGLGEFEEGWILHESRLKKLNNKGLFASIRPDCPQWTGELIKGKTLMIFPEQGIGDQIQFIRYVDELRQMDVQHIYVYCIKPLSHVFSSLNAQNITLIHEGTPLPLSDYFCHLLSLAFLCNTTLTTIPSKVPYLKTNDKLSTVFRLQLEKISGLKVGLCWSGSKKYKHDAERSLELASFMPLREIAGIRLFNLQKDARTQFLETFGETAYDIGHEIDAAYPPFKETAALIINLDLVITCDTAIGHLAGALGKPVWLLLPYTADWRWMTNRPDTPWYPNTQLFRQNETRSWTEVLARVKHALEKNSQDFSNQKKLTSPIMDENEDAILTINTPISVGEFFDKIGILEIKQARIQNPDKLVNIVQELNELTALIPVEFKEKSVLNTFRVALKKTNEALWDIEDKLREIEKTQIFDSNFINLARMVYQKNDYRAHLKSEINKLTKSKYREEKSYVTLSSKNTK